MAYTKKKRGYREITVDGVSYRWCLKMAYPNSALVLQGAMPSGQQLIIDLRNWHDPVYDICGFSEIHGELTLYTDQQNKPASIAPSFARRAIQYGLAHGWNPTQSTSALHFDCVNGVLGTHAGDEAEATRTLSPFMKAVLTWGGPPLSNDDHAES